MKKIMLTIIVALLALTAWLLWPQKEEPQTSPSESRAQAETSAEDSTPAERPAMKGRHERTARAAFDEVAEADDPEGDLRLEGQVVDEGDLPVEGAIVSVSTKPSRTAKTGKDGTFYFDRLVGRRFRLTARHGDRVGGPVLHRLTEASDPVVIRLRAGAAVIVKVSDASDKQPVSGALVELRGLDKLPAVTDARGTARLEGVTPGYATLMASASGYAPAHKLVSVPESTTQALEVAVELRRGGRVSGRVITTDGQPVEGARVLAENTAALFSLADSERDGAQTNEEGRFSLEAVAEGTCRLTASHPDHPTTSSRPVTVSLSRPVPDVEIVMKQGAAIAGRVIGTDGSPAAWARVRCTRTDATPFAGGTIGGHRQRGATADGEGNFELKGLPLAELVLMAVSEVASSDTVQVDLSQGGRIEGIELRLAAGGTISGKVITDTGEPVADAEVLARPDFWAGGLNRKTRLRGRSSTVTDGGGNFTFSGLCEGSYRLSATRSAGSFRRFTRQGIEAKTGDEDVEIVLAEDGSLGGRLAFATGGNPTSFSVALNMSPGVPCSSADGSFELPAVAPGKYMITFRGRDFADKVLSDVEVQGGGKTDLGSIEVQPGRDVSGRVIDESGEPVPGATVVVAERLVGDGSNLVLDIGAAAEERMGLRRGTSDPDGYFRVGGIGTSRYVMLAEHAGLGRSDLVVIPEGTASPTHDLVLHNMGSISGRVTKKGQPAAGAVVQVNSEGEVAKTIVVHAGDDGNYIVEKIEAGRHRVTAALVSGPGGGARSQGSLVTVEPGQSLRVDIDIPAGEVTLVIDVKGKEGAKVDAAQILLLAGEVNISTANELNRVAMSSPGSISQTFWLPVKPAEFKEVQGGKYTLCAIPINGNMNDPTFLQHLRKNTAHLKVYCSPFEVPAGGEELKHTLVVPPMDPLPEEAE